MKKEEFCFDSRDGRSQLHAVRYLPEDQEIRYVVQIVHGMAEYVERYEEFAAFLTEKGCVVTGEDHLGHGSLAEKQETLGYFCDRDPATVVVRDVHRLKKMTQREFPYVPYFILGHSMGSFILRNYLCKYGNGIQGAIIMGTGMQSRPLILLSRGLAGIIRLCKGSHHVSRFLDQAAFGSYNKKITQPRTEVDWLSRDTQKVDDYRADPLCGFPFTVNGFQTLFTLIDRLHKPHNLQQIPKELPVLMVSGKEDPVGDYGKGVKKAYHSLLAAGMSHVTLKMYDFDRHELLNELDREKVMNDIWDWLETCFAAIDL